MQHLEFYFHEFEKNFYSSEEHISHVQHILCISSESPFHTLVTQVYDISSIHHYFIFIGLQRSIRQDFYKFQKIIKKKRVTKKRFCKLARLIIDQFYLLISLEGM